MKFKVQPYQTNAVDSVVGCSAGQPMASSINYRIDPGTQKPSTTGYKGTVNAFEEGFKTADIALSEAQVLANIQDVQRRQNLPLSQSLTDFTVVNTRANDLRPRRAGREPLPPRCRDEQALRLVDMYGLSRHFL